MTTSQPRISAGIPSGGQFTNTDHAEPALRLDTQASLYAAAIQGDETARAEAARNAIRTSGGLLTEEDSHLLEDETQFDDDLINAVDDLGPLDEEEQGDFGKLLTEHILDTAREREEAYWAGRYKAERHLDRAPAGQESAYEPNDPKHPDYLTGNRVD